MEKYTYILLLVASISIPLIRSFETRVAFHKKWPRLFKGILVMMLIFIPWDVIFTRMNVWWFNYEYIMGIYIVDLPLEEWLFFIIITYCCVFVYEVVKYFFPRFYYPRAAWMLTLGLGIFTMWVAFANTHRIYTFIVMYLSSVLLFWQLATKTHKTWLSHFYLMYFISLIPFAIVNGVLTSFPVVLYDNAQNLAIRMGTIPFEDAFYFISMMFITIMVYEGSARQKSKSGQQKHKRSLR